MPQESNEKKSSSADAKGAGRASWETKARNLLRSELRRRGISSEELVERLQQIGLKENARNVSNKISRGRFSAVFLLQCLDAIGARDIHLVD